MNRVSARLAPLQRRPAAPPRAACICRVVSRARMPPAGDSGRQHAVRMQSLRRIRS